MATLTKPKDTTVDYGIHYSGNNIASGVPKPFPTPAEREQEELLDTLASEELRLQEDGGLSEENTISVDQVQRTDDFLTSEDLWPSRVDQVQSTCLTALRSILVVPNRTTRSVQDRRHSMPASPSAQASSELQALVTELRVQEAGGDMSEWPVHSSKNELLAELRMRVDRLTHGLLPRDVELARTLVSLLVHLNELASTSSRPSEPPLPRASSWSAVPSSLDPYSQLRRQVSDFQLERSTSQEGIRHRSTPTQAVQTALLWSEIDSELETVLSLCRSHSLDDPFADNLPPEYDPAGYVFGGEQDSLPQYEPRPEDAAGDAKPSHKAQMVLNGTTSRLHDNANEKMKLDLEAVTRAIDHLYSVAPQLHNQRVELNKSKLEDMERAKCKGKQRAADGEMETRELERMLELIGKASERKLSNQAVFIDESLKRKMEVMARQKDQEKRAQFVEQLANHSEAGRMHSQDAIFPASSVRSSSQPALSDTLDPHAMLTLPEFMSEHIPDTVQRRMQQERNPETMLTLPEFIREHPVPDKTSTTPVNRRQSISQSASPDHLKGTATTNPTQRFSKGNRSRSMSEPLAWLLSPRSSSPAVGSSLGLKRHASKKSIRPGSSNGNLPEVVEETLDVSYVAEYHENLQHVLVFLTVTGLQPGYNLEAELAPSESDAPAHLVLKSHTAVSPPLELPTHVHPPAMVSVVGGHHYQIKLASFKPPSSSESTSFSEHASPDLLDANHFQSIKPTTFICSSCSLPLVRASLITRYRDLPSEHWAELVDAWMCHSDQKLHEHVQRGSKEGFWPTTGEALVGGSYVLMGEDVVVKDNLCDLEPHNTSKHIDDWQRIRCICGAIIGRRRHHEGAEGQVMAYRMAKYAFRPVSPTAEPTRTPLSAFIVEDMQEYVHAHATYRFVFMDEEEERPRILVWLFKPNMRLSYTTPTQYVIAKSGSLRVAKILFKILGSSTSIADLPSISNKYPGFPQAEHLYYPMEVCRRLAALLKESNTAYPESMRTMTGLDVGWLQRA